MMRVYPEDKTYRKAVVRITDLVEVDGILDGFLFEGCQINGPAVLLLVENNSLVNSNLGGPADAMLWDVPPSRERVLGAIAAKACTFDGCAFTNVGFAAPPEFIKRFLEGTGDNA